MKEAGGGEQCGHRTSVREQRRHVHMGLSGREQRPDTQRKGRMGRQGRCGVMHTRGPRVQ